MTDMNIPPVAVQTAASQPAAQATTSQLSGDFDTFLRMLTTQIRYQDPLNPMDGADFAVQLATFSGVEQQVQTNALLQRMAAADGASLAAFSGWIGKEARVAAPAYYGDKPLTLDLQPDPRATDSVLITLDTYGRPLTREHVGNAAGLVEWAGRDAAGNRLPPGIYSFRLESRRGDEVLAERPVATYAQVIEAEQTPSGIKLVLAGGHSVDVAEVQAIRAAQ
ncbi:MAG: flagellar hook capping FlgD N-terminal domain-containing protein [Paracoccus sp. (in: a-proteobacteria)]|nr:flagellar hook capping FlgD N-terminal domain-containing protein [Paracoccus sp. (in: a-proteobacteria)]